MLLFLKSVINYINHNLEKLCGAIHRNTGIQYFFKQQVFIAHSSRSWTSKIKTSIDLVSDEAPSLTQGWHLLHAFSHGGRGRSLWGFLFLKFLLGTTHTGGFFKTIPNRLTLYTG
jgi:hypothetical protein